MIQKSCPEYQRITLSVWTVIFLALFLSATFYPPLGQASQAINVVNAGSAPEFTDTASRQSLLTAARRHRSYLAQLADNYTTNFNGTTYHRNWLIESLDEFITLVQKASSSQQLHREILERFDIYQSSGRHSGTAGTMLVTGYFEPLLDGSLQQTKEFPFPIYALPPSLVNRVNSETGETDVGRIGENDTFLPFWSRAEIEENNMLAGSELLYLKTPLDAFFLQIQGSGKIRLPDGNLRSVGFAGHNGHGYKSIGKLLVDEGKLQLGNSSTPNIKKYLTDHPEEQRRILHHNPRMIFFDWQDGGPPLGSLGLPLTSGRSIAVDKTQLPTDIFCWLSTTLPIVDEQGSVTAWMPDSRFVLPQDSGSAIKGPGRVDIFMGAGHYAEHAAGSMRQSGKLYFFIKKGYSPK